jgi:glycine/D-amino acid oxidase-like deaminating enzyme
MGQIVTQPISQRPSTVMHGPRGVAACGALSDLPSFRREAFAAPNPLHGLDDLSEADVDDWDYDDCITHYQDGSLHIGSSIDVTGSLNPHISIRATQAMIAMTIERYEAYSKFGVTSLWAGLQSTTADLLPVVDRVDGAYVNVGHASGMATGPVSGRTMARMIAGEHDEFADHLRADRPSLTSAQRHGAPDD